MNSAARPAAPVGWKLRLEDPLNRYYRYPIARLITRALVGTRVTPNQVTLVQPFMAAFAGWLVTFEDARHLAMAAIVFELRSILDCVDGTLARAKKMSSPFGHAIDGLADWLSVVFLYAGIFWHFHLHPPPAGPWSPYVSTTQILMLALATGALRSFASDYYKTKFVSIFEKGVDETVEALRAKVRALQPDAPFFAKMEVFIGRAGHLCFEHAWFDPSSTSAEQERVDQVRREENQPTPRFLAILWSISNGDSFISIIMVTLLVDQLWLGQVFFATAGLVWILAVNALNGSYFRGAARRAVVVA